MIVKSKKIIIGIVLLSIALFVSACTPTTPPKDNGNKDLEEQIKEKDIKIKELEAKIKELEQDKDEEVEEDDDLLINLGKVIKALKKEDMGKLKEYIHPEKGVRFTAYPYVDVETDIVLKSDEIVEVFNNPKTYIWGSYDGKGDPIELSFKDYYEEFVYDEDFLNAPIIGNNKSVTGGNTIDNVKEAYPDGKFAELYFDVFEEQYSGMDWKSLKLVFEKHEEKWYLVGVIHGQWTI